MQRRAGAQRGNGNGNGRTSVKSQRRVNQQQAPRGGGKKQNKENGQTNKGSRAAPIGVSGVSLSSRFQTLQKVALVDNPAPKAKAALKKKSPVVNVKKPQLRAKTPVVRTAKQQQKAKKQEIQQKQQKQQQQMKKVADANRTKRQQTMNSRRKGLEVAAPDKNAAKKTSKPAAKKAALAKGNGASRGRKGDDKKKEKPVTGDDLDVEMEAYWHAAGKGPDPHAARLDRQMDDYWAGKPKPEGESEAAS
ncbi:hypothetical protein Poli38472_000624 [Pythium oligandrum]|uniref:Chromatin target of PRMT1 protein C-terminal domain-containing protein n=1 Tax=Pythium oligandrum TaxID=41045 RepID=A0A8K1CE45_PYTOL|nr:hypothetical protein Poli38472_000624 [Pythium oligandrum]|eukprot:TMW60582.1 hypothetical protein Poli38472_000624 [Pythium oligandrum]